MILFEIWNLEFICNLVLGTCYFRYIRVWFCTMTGAFRKSTIWAFGIGLLCCVPGISHAENHALLIGIGNYKQRTLEGPAYDVAALARVLIEHYDFKRVNVRTLVNQEAGKFRVLGEMQRLVQISRPGDRVFIYFSGHGTSRRDELLSLPLPHASGALVPADFKWDSNQSIETQVSQLIVGKRDLRPILTQLDQDRQVLVVFDTCFSGNTVRGIGEPKLADVNRYIPLDSKSVFSEEQHIGSFAENLKPNEPYPYQNTFYISASTENETAKDIRTRFTLFVPDHRRQSPRCVNGFPVEGTGRPNTGGYQQRWSLEPDGTYIKPYARKFSGDSGKRPRHCPRKAKMLSGFTTVPFLCARPAALLPPANCRLD